MCPSATVGASPPASPHNRRPGGHGTANTTADAHATEGSTPRYRAGQRPLPGGSTRVEASRYLPGGKAVPVAGP